MLLVGAQSHRIGHASGHGLAQYRLGPAFMQPLAVGQVHAQFQQAALGKRRQRGDAVSRGHTGIAFGADHRIGVLQGFGCLGRGGLRLGAAQGLQALQSILGSGPLCERRIQPGPGQHLLAPVAFAPGRYQAT